MSRTLEHIPRDRGVADLLAALERQLAAVAPQDAPALFVGLMKITMSVLLKIMPGVVPGPGADGRREDRLLTVAEAAAKLGLSKDHLYRHAAHYPFTVRLGHALRFSARGIERYIRQRQGR
jgi:predicted DNA-binding transcriptional regulator AlpA